MQINRYLRQAVQNWISQRMIFVGGPRQVGKTFFAKTFLHKGQGYLSWDDLADRELLKSHALPSGQNLLVLDEIHKYPRWRMLLKGLYDKSEPKPQLIITGSARLDQFRRGGDSLFGRYHYFRMHPLTLPEVGGLGFTDSADLMMRFGGFPEPFLKQSESFAKIWRRERQARVIQQDLRDLTALRDYSQLELMADLLPERVGSLFSIGSIAEDLEKSPHTIKAWLEILESVYLCYSVLPFGPPKVKAVKKQAKVYLWDWSAVPTVGPRFENMVASHLLKYCHYIEDTEGDKMELRFLKDQYGREIDFVVLKNKKPIFAVECKTGEKTLSSHIRYFKERTNIPRFYQVHLGQRSAVVEGVPVLPFREFCKQVGLV